MISHKANSSDDFFAHWASVQPMIARTSPIRAGGRGPAGSAMAGPLFSQNGSQSTYFFKIVQGGYHSRTTSITAGPLLLCFRRACRYRPIIGWTMAR